MTLSIPTADVPYYKPMVIPPSDLEPPAGVKADTKEELDVLLKTSEEQDKEEKAEEAAEAAKEDERHVLHHF